MTTDEHHNTEPDELEPELRRAPISEEVKNARELRDSQIEADQAEIEPRIKEHLDLHRGVITWLKDVHQWIVDTYNFDIAGDSRPAAVWKMSGRILGFCDLIIDCLEMGYTAEVTSLGRDVHEANRLLEVFLMPKEKDLLETWLADRNIPANTVRKAEKRFQAEIEAIMKEQGADQQFPAIDRLSGQIYGELSGASHHRRKWVDDNVIENERRMITGKTDVWLRRAATTESMLAVIEESIIIVGDAFSQFNKPDWYTSQVGRLLQSLISLRAVKPLS